MIFGQKKNIFQEEFNKN